MASTKKTAKLLKPELDRYCRHRRPVYLKNHTGSVIMLSFTDSKNHDHIVKVPHGTRPFCLTDYVSHAMAADDNNLRRLLSEGHLELLHYKTDPSDKQNAARLVVPSSDEEEEEAIKNVAPDVEIEQEVIDASPQVAFIVASVISEDMSPKEFLKRMDGMTTAITDQDCIHVNNELGREYPEIAEWATSTLADLRENYPDRCKKGASSNDMHKKLAKKGREILERETERNASAKESARKTLGKAQVGIEMAGSAKAKAKAMLESQQKARQHRMAKSQGGDV